MKKILTLVILGTSFYSCNSPKKSSNQTDSAKTKSATTEIKTDSLNPTSNKLIWNARYVIESFQMFRYDEPIQTDTASEEIDAFSTSMSASLPSGARLDEQLGGRNLYPDRKSPFFDRVRFDSLRNFYSNARFLIIYPVVRKAKGPIDFCYALAQADSTLLPRFLDASDQISHTTFKNNFKAILEAQNHEGENMLLGKGFYSNGNHFSIHIDVQKFDNWLKTKGPNAHEVQFLPGLLVNSKQEKILTVIARVVDSQRRILGSNQDSYFNVTYPCPPPRDCK